MAKLPQPVVGLEATRQIRRELPHSLHDLVGVIIDAATVLTLEERGDLALAIGRDPGLLASLLNRDEVMSAVPAIVTDHEGSEDVSAVVDPTAVKDRPGSLPPRVAPAYIVQRTAPAAPSGAAWVFFFVIGALVGAGTLWAALPWVERHYGVSPLTARYQEFQVVIQSQQQALATAIARCRPRDQPK